LDLSWEVDEVGHKVDAGTGWRLCGGAGDWEEMIFRQPMELYLSQPRVGPIILSALAKFDCV
jgi:hypothetical protein